MIKSAAQYHFLTSYDRHKMEGHVLDWANQPTIYKTYPGLQPVALAKDARLSSQGLPELLKDRFTEDIPRVPILDDLSRIFRLTYSLTAQARHPQHSFYCRSAPSAGALYPTEIYVATQGVTDLENGMYHFSSAHHSLSILRKGDFMESIVEMAEPVDNRLPILTFFLSVIFFRSAWKYQGRCYRYHLLDTGHVIENLILALKSLALPFSLSYDFNDHEVNRFLGLDETKEVSLAVMHVLGPEKCIRKSATEIPDLPDEMKNVSRVSGKEIDYPAVREIHRAGERIVSMPRPDGDMLNALGVTPDAWSKIDPCRTWPEVMNYPESVSKRRSQRNFVRKPMSWDHLTALLDGLCTVDLSAAEGPCHQYQSICTGYLMGNAEGWGPGFYLLNPSTRSLGMVSPGIYTTRMAHICLDQTWLAHSAVHFLFMANLDMLDRHWGARGYRHAMMLAGRMGERLYLMATAMGLGSCGIGAFFDGEAAELLGLNSKSRLLYLVAVGPVKIDAL